MSPNAPEVHTALRMMPLFERGREALRLKLCELPARDRPIGGMNIDVVTYDDFVTQAALILRHVVVNGAATHILCQDGSLVALIERRIGNW